MQIEIEFFDYWHCSSGSSGGSRADLLVVKDDRGLPYVPGKTIKGHIKEIAELMGNSEFLDICFGSNDNREGECYFSNATINEDIDKELIPYLYKTISSTKIDENGLAVDNTLREIEVVVPLKLYANIEFEGESKKYKKEIKDALSQVKRMGLNRNRGLGRCEISVIGDGND